MPRGRARCAPRARAPRTPVQSGDWRVLAPPCAGPIARGVGRSARHPVRTEADLSAPRAAGPQVHMESRAPVDATLPRHDWTAPVPPAHRLARLLHPARVGGHLHPRSARRHHRRVHELLARLLRRRAGAGRHPRQRRHLRLRRRGQARRQLHADHGRLGRRPVRAWRCSSRRWSGWGCRSRRPGSWSLYFCCIGMFGVGVGMLYTPILVDRMQLDVPVRATRSPTSCARSPTCALLKRSIAKLGGGTLAPASPAASALSFVARRPGSARIGLLRLDARRRHDRRRAHRRPGAGRGRHRRCALTPWLRAASAGSDAHDPFRKIGFIVALGMILGAAIVDMSHARGAGGARAVRRGAGAPAASRGLEADRHARARRLGRRSGARRIVAGRRRGCCTSRCVLRADRRRRWCSCSCWSTASRSASRTANPISSAFVVTVFILPRSGYAIPIVGLMCAAILLGRPPASAATCSRTARPAGASAPTASIQFRYQVDRHRAWARCWRGAGAAVHDAPTRSCASNQFAHPDTPGVEKWQSAMTFKFVGALDGLTHPSPHVMNALRARHRASASSPRSLRKLHQAQRRLPGLGRGSARARLRRRTSSLDACSCRAPTPRRSAASSRSRRAAWFGAGGVARRSLLQTAARAGAAARGRTARRCPRT